MIQILGLCRFSYPTGENTGFAKTADLYDPGRLERRLTLFETIALPALAAQTDPDFRLLVLVGKNMPGPARDRLRAALARVPQAMICAEAEGQPHVELCARLLLQHRDAHAERVAELRVDDDDAIAVDFAARLRDHAARILNGLGSDRPVEIDFHNGVALRTGPDRKMLAITAAHWTPAQAFLMVPDDRRTAFNFNHSQFWKRDLCLCCPDPMMFIRTFHGENDSSLDWAAVERMASPSQPPDLARRMDDRFGVSPAALARL